MGNNLAKIMGTEPGEAIENLLGGANRVLNLSANLRLDRDSKFSKTLNVLGIATSVGWALRSGYTFIRDLRDETVEYRVKIGQEDNMYEFAQKLAMESIPDKDKTDLIARARWDGERSYVSTIFDSELHQEVTIRDFKVIISTDTIVLEDDKKKDSPADVNFRGARRNRTTRSNSIPNGITIICPSLAARNAVLEELASRIVVNTRRDPRLYLARDYGDFSSARMTKRSPESVILEAGQMDRVLNHIDVFLSNEKAYAELGIPYHTGALFYGPPGTGKTSITSVISGRFGLDVYHISLNSVNGDAALFELFSEIPEKSVVLFEDLDISPSASDRDSDEKERVTMSGLLNVLDGNLSPHGMIAILTTNHVDSLDPAIIRPGRVDLTEEFSYLNQDQLERTCEYFMGHVPEGLPEITKDHSISSADIVGVFRTNVLDIGATGPDLIEFLKGKMKIRTIKKKKKELVA